MSVAGSRVASLLAASAFVVVLAIVIVPLDSEATDVTSDITRDTTWFPAGNPWTVRESIVVQNGATLRIEAGVEVKIDGGHSIRCLGTGRVRANGIVDDIIVFTSNWPTGQDYEFVMTGAGGEFRNCSFSQGRTCLIASNDARVIDCIFFDATTGIHLLGDRTSIVRSKVSNCNAGIYVDMSSRCSITRTNVSRCVKGINLVNGSANTVLDGCTVFGCEVRGIEIHTTGLGTRVLNCSLSNSGMGILVWQSRDVALYGVTAEDCNKGLGIFETSPRPEEPIAVRRCIVRGCVVGLRLSIASWSLVNETTFRTNVVAIDETNPIGPGVAIWNNNFLWNEARTDIDTHIINWSRDGRGNFWTDYQGIDTDGDGIGDTPFNISRVERDEHPLMAPVDFEDPVAAAGPDVTVRQHSPFALDGSASTDDTWVANWTWTLALPGGDVVRFGPEVGFVIDEAGTFTVTLTVVDAVGRMASDSLTVEVTDGDPPSFIGINTPGTVWNGGSLNFSCRVRDNVAVGSVVLDYMFGGGVVNRLDLVQHSDGVWSLEIDIPIDIDGDVYYTLLARDVSGNINTTEYLTVRVLDGQPPTLNPTLPSGVFTGDPAVLRCEISDNRKVVNGTVEVWFPNVECRSLALVRSTSDWSAEVTIPSCATSPMSVRFSAMDGAGNVGISALVEVIVFDNDPPEIESFRAFAGLRGFQKGGTAYFEAVASDNIGVLSACLEFRYYATEWESMALLLGGDVYSTFLEVATDMGARFWYHLNVTDAAGNSAVTDEAMVDLLSQDPRILTSPDTEVREGAHYSVQFEAEDLDSGVLVLTWSIETNATWLQLDPDSGEVWGDPGSGDVGWYTVNLSVEDGEGGLDWLLYIVSVIDVNFPPEVVILNPVNGTRTDAVLVVSGHASDDEGGLVWVRVRVDEGEWKDADGTSAWSLELNVEDLQRGKHTIYVVAFDGNSESDIASVTIVAPGQEGEGGSGLVIAGALVAAIFGCILVAVLLRRRTR